MWQVGFKNKMTEWLEKENNEVVEILPNEMTFTLSKQNDDQIHVSFSRDDEEKRLILTFEEMYGMLVPNGKMDYYYLLDEVVLAMSDGTAPVLVNQFRKNLLTKLIHDFWKQRHMMEDITKLHTFETELIVCSDGVVYEQFVLC